jgi:hypothetical protein
VCLVKVAPHVIVLVVVAQPSLRRVLVSVGKVVVNVNTPEKTVAGGSSDVLVDVTRIDSIVVVASAVTVVVVVIGVAAVIVVVSESGARRWISRAFSLRFCLAASMRARAHS